MAAAPPSTAPQRTFKILFAGPSACGKSNLISQIAHGEFSERYSATFGVDYSVKPDVRRGGGHADATLQLWDTASSERMMPIMSAAMSGTHLFVVVFSVTDRASFEAVPKWFACVRKAVPSKELFVVLAANKCDDAAARVVSRAEGTGLAAELGCYCCVETSAKTRQGINELVGFFARLLP
jgi:Ras-related protein Rab-18